MWSKLLLNILISIFLIYSFHRLWDYLKMTYSKETTKDLINFINQNESFESPILITGYSQKNSEPLIKKFINNFRLNKVLKSIFLKIIFVIEKRIVSKKYQNKETSAEKITIDSEKVTIKPSKQNTNHLKNLSKKIDESGDEKRKLLSKRLINLRGNSCNVFLPDNEYYNQVKF